MGSDGTAVVSRAAQRLAIHGHGVTALAYLTESVLGDTTQDGRGRYMIWGVRLPVR
jgi:hypothetical protein